MKAAYLQESRGSSLRDEIFQTIRNTKFKSVSNLLHQTRKREHSFQHHSSRNSHLKPSVDSLLVQTQLSGPRLSFSPPCHSPSKVSAHRSTDYLRSPSHRHPTKNPAINLISRGKKQDNYDLSHPKKTGFHKRNRSNPKRRHKTVRSPNDRTDIRVKSRSRKSGSRDKGSSRLNLSSILEQESSESNLVTPSSKAGKSRYRQGRKLSGDRTKKKGRQGLKDIVWKRLERCIRQPQKFQRLMKNDIMSLRFRVLRRTLLQIQVHATKQLSKLSITLHKGNIECQGIQQYFPRFEPNGYFSLYSSVRGIDLTDPLRLPQLLIQAILNEEERFQKLVTLPYSWIQMAEHSNLKQISRSHIKTKSFIQNMPCSRLSLKGLAGILPGWSCQSAGRGVLTWESRLCIGEQEFEFKVIEKQGRFSGELCGRGEEQLTRMLQFLQELLG